MEGPIRIWALHPGATGHATDHVLGELAVSQLMSTNANGTSSRHSEVEVRNSRVGQGMNPDRRRGWPRHRLPS